MFEIFIIVYIILFIGQAIIFMGESSVDIKNKYRHEKDDDE